MNAPFTTLPATHSFVGTLQRYPAVTLYHGTDGICGQRMADPIPTVCVEFRNKQAEPSSLERITAEMRRHGTSCRWESELVSAGAEEKRPRVADTNTHDQTHTRPRASHSNEKNGRRPHKL
jgi:hypothetical protein